MHQPKQHCGERDSPATSLCVPCASTRCRNARKKNSSASDTTQKIPQNVSTNNSPKFHHESGCGWNCPKRTMIDERGADGQEKQKMPHADAPLFARGQEAEARFLKRSQREHGHQSQPDPHELAENPRARRAAPVARICDRISG